MFNWFRIACAHYAMHIKWQLFVAEQLSFRGSNLKSRRQKARTHRQTDAQTGRQTQQRQATVEMSFVSVELCQKKALKASDNKQRQRQWEGKERCLLARVGARVGEWSQCCKASCIVSFRIIMATHRHQTACASVCPTTLSPPPSLSLSLSIYISLCLSWPMHFVYCLPAYGNFWWLFRHTRFAHCLRFCFCAFFTSFADTTSGRSQQQQQR